MYKNSNLSKIKKGAYALIITKENNVLLQKRDTKTHVENFGKIGMFGGAIKDNEKLFDGLKRELLEELELIVDEYKTEKLNAYQKIKELDGIDHHANV